MSRSTETGKLTEISSSIRDLKLLKKLDEGISWNGLMEAVGTIVLVAADKGDSDLLLVAAGGGLVAGLGGFSATLLRESEIGALREEAREIKFSEQADKLAKVVRKIPQETFADIWETIQEVRSKGTIESGEFIEERISPTFDAMYQAFADRAGESPERLD